MQKMFNLLILASLLCLTACASPTPVPTLTPPATSTSLPPTLQTTSTLEPTATVAPTETPAPEFDEKAEKAKLKALIESAPENFQDLDYLQSPEYLQHLKELDAQGLLPNVSNNARFIKPNEIVLRLDKLETDNVYQTYGITNAYSIDSASSWWNLEKTPFTLVDIGRVSDVDGMVYTVYKWKNSDNSVSFQGFIGYANHSKIDLNDPKNYIDFAGFYPDYSFEIYPIIGYYDGANGCKKHFTSSEYLGGYTKYCDIVADNQGFFEQQEIIDTWNSTGILKNQNKLRFTPMFGKKIHKP